MRVDFRNIALRHKYPENENGKDYDIANDLSDDTRIFDWITDKVSKPSDSDMETWFQGWSSQEYARNRKIDYDALNQFELMTDDAINSTTTHHRCSSGSKDQMAEG